jgi:glycosyltransferase involved in cell wall biosynthesis
VLASLRNQTLDKQRWEFLLIDNASDEPLSLRADLSWHPNGHHVREEKLGLTHARLRGIKETRSEMLVFVDDDNVLDRDYLDQVLLLSTTWPMIGAFSGQVRARFEEPPAEWTKKYWNRLAIREFSQDRWSNIACLDHTTPNGAGLCVRRQVATEYLAYHQNGKRKIVLDRTGTSLLSAGDLDLASTACDLGLGNGLFASLKLTHLIPRQRVEETYLTRLLESQAFSAVVLDSFRSNGQPLLPKGLRTVVADQLRILSMDRRDRRLFRALKSGERKAKDLLSNRR